MTDNEQYSEMKGNFGVPPQYFDSSAGRIRERVSCYVELRGLNSLLKLKEQNPFIVPEGYFEQQLEVQITGSTGRLKKESGFTVPENYFEQRRPLAAITGGRKESGIFSLTVKRWSLAAAAAVVVILGVWLYQSYTSPVEGACTTIACLERKDLVKSRAIENLSEEELMLLIDAESFEQLLFEENGGPDEDTNEPNDQTEV